MATRTYLLDARGAASPSCMALITLEIQALTTRMTRKRKTRAVDLDLNGAFSLGVESGSSSEEESAEADNIDDDPSPKLQLTTVENKPPPTPDVAAQFASKRARIFVYSVFCMTVQMFMSYDGGALPASIEIIQRDFSVGGNPWSQAELGLLGAMDKIGTVVAAMPWGWALRKWNAKLLLCCSLLINAAACFAFGDARNKYLMYALRFLMGTTQSLQGVWGTVWTLLMAPPESKTLWLGLGAVSAGLGNGLGFAVGGFGTAQGLPYAFAFQLAAVVLGCLWIIQLFVPSQWLRVHDAGRPKRDADDEESDNDGDDSPSTKEQLKQLMQNTIYVYTALAISMVMFVISGIQFLWNQAFLAIWDLDQNWVTLMMLVVTGAGSGCGIAYGPRHIDKNGGFGTYPGLLKSLRSLWKFSVVAAVAGIFGLLSLFQKLKDPDQIWGEWGDPYLYMVWLSIFFVTAAQNASVAALCGINMETVPSELRPFASGTEITIRNIFGFSLGPLLPGMLMTQLTAAFSWDLSNKRENSYQFICGLAFVLVMNVASPTFLAKAHSAAKNKLAEQQEKTLDALRQAFQKLDVDALCNAVLLAERVHLQNTARGQAVITLANREIGQLRQAETRVPSIGASQTHVPGRTPMTLSDFSLVGPRPEIRVRAENVERKVMELEMLARQQAAEIQGLRRQLQPHGNGDGARLLTPLIPSSPVLRV